MAVLAAFTVVGLVVGGVRQQGPDSGRRGGSRVVQLGSLPATTVPVSTTGP